MRSDKSDYIKYIKMIKSYKSLHPQSIYSFYEFTPAGKLHHKRKFQHYISNNNIQNCVIAGDMGGLVYQGY